MMAFVDPKTAQDMEVWDGRATLSTLADALAKLQELGALADEDHAQIRTIPMRLPDGGTAAIVEIIPRVARPRRSILMPSSTGFTAKDTLGAQHRYEIGRLDGAIGDADGNVQLRDGVYVHAVELVPARLVRELTLEQERILRLAINFL